MSRIRIALFTQRAAAETACQRLRAAGVPAELNYEPATARLWFVSKRGGGVRLEVPPRFAAHATRFLVQSGADADFLQDAVRCPDCRSFRVDFPQFTEKSLLTNVAIGLLAELRLLERQYYCEECHCMWGKVGNKPPRPRAHTAPNYFLEGTE